MRVLLVVPAYNEAKNILDVVKSIEHAGYDYVVIDDGSTDCTQEVCKDNNINRISLSQNLGIGGAVQTGHRYALLNNYDVDIQFDGDGQHDIHCVPDLLNAIEEGADIAIGSRFLRENEGFKSTFIRRVGIKWLKGWIRLFTGSTITDATSGFRACNRRAITLFCDYYPSDYPEPESIVYATEAGLKVSEVSVIMHDRQSGASTINAIAGAYYMIKVSLAIAMIKLARRK